MSCYMTCQILIQLLFCVLSSRIFAYFPTMHLSDVFFFWIYMSCCMACWIRFNFVALSFVLQSFLLLSRRDIPSKRCRSLQYCIRLQHHLHLMMYQLMGYSLFIMFQLKFTISSVDEFLGHVNYDNMSSTVFESNIHVYIWLCIN